ncbi:MULTISPECIES: NAD(P)H-dependent oxidoreductase [unclassified Myroides]|uniref:NADPH-dependent FMN reductase n=1 Tax=unclassified Myroides TaxID=2642485 RepID=UPI0015FBBC55|nr:MULTISPECIES: NAD(P)H-dependent oxidoreductase [unclassified Myroides]MBB1149312.1 NAD(P)H-dependent oxidoreductase [Myroides sp. NP-2]MDM1406783.1 NAD(P)H-dependent oxidoreductase [Myroides sp. DF42-4-2]
MKITAFAASNSRQSINLELVKHALADFGEHEIQLLDLNDYEMPIYSPERNQEGVPTQALAFNQILKNSDALIIGLAEHNGTFSTAFKNIFDWGSRVDKTLFQQKPMFLLSTSPGPRGGQFVMESAKNIFPFFGGNIKSHFSLPSFQDNFKDGTIVDDNLKIEFQARLGDFKSTLQQH